MYSAPTAQRVVGARVTLLRIEGDVAVSAPPGTQGSHRRIRGCQPWVRVLSRTEGAPTETIAPYLRSLLLEDAPLGLLELRRGEHATVP